MQKGPGVIYILIVTLALIGIASVAYYLRQQHVLTNENFCHNFGYQKCPISICSVGPSCPMCMDIGCHAKEAHWGKDKFYSK